MLKIVTENFKKRKNIEIKKLLHKYPSNRWFRNEIYSLIRRAGARWSADTICRM